MQQTRPHGIFILRDIILADKQVTVVHILQDGRRHHPSHQTSPPPILFPTTSGEIIRREAPPRPARRHQFGYGILSGRGRQLLHVPDNLVASGTKNRLTGDHVRVGGRQHRKPLALLDIPEEERTIIC